MLGYGVGLIPPFFFSPKPNIYLLQGLEIHSIATHCLVGEEDDIYLYDICRKVI